MVRHKEKSKFLLAFLLCGARRGCYQALAETGLNFGFSNRELFRSEDATQ